MQPYQPSGPIDCTSDFTTSNVQGKTAIVTGGANGIGEIYVRSLVKAGAAHVIIADIAEAAGRRLEEELSPAKATFVRCDVMSWQEQADAFRTAKVKSPTGRIDIAVANAGISGLDDVVINDPEADEPNEPNLAVTNINGTGVIYTTKLAMWYFSKQHAQSPSKDEDQCLVLQASLAGYLDVSGLPQYSFTKFGVRGFMRTLRQTAWQQGVRVNLIAPWYIHTGIMPDHAISTIEDSGAEFADLQDSGPALLRIVADRDVNGRGIALVPRSWPQAPRGYMDLPDDFEPESFWGRLQHAVLLPMKLAASQQQAAETA